MKKLLILGLLLIAIIGALSSIFSIRSNKQSYSLLEEQKRGLEKKESPCQTDFGTVDAPRDSATGAFSSALTDAHVIRVISPGKLVGDARFTYLWIKNGQSIPVYAPADGVLVQIFYKTRSDLSPTLSEADYDMVFVVDCHTFYRINHITSPIASLADQKPITKPLEIKPGSGFDNRDVTPKSAVVVKAGAQIGTTTGTPTAHNFDFGVFVDKQAVCPYQEFGEPVRSQFLSLLGNTTTPIVGTPCDVNGMY